MPNKNCQVVFLFVYFISFKNQIKYCTLVLLLSSLFFSCLFYFFLLHDDHQLLLPSFVFFAAVVSFVVHFKIQSK